jgi:DNA-dependent RNA polymerase auxiliary subunit epsilon
LADTSAEEQAPSNVSEQAQAVVHVNVASPLPMVDMDAGFAASDSVSREAANVTALDSVANDTASDALQSVPQETATVTAASGSVSQKAINYTASDFAAVAAAVDVKATESDANIVEERLPMIGQDGADVNDVGVPAGTSATLQPVDEATNATVAEMDAMSRAKVQQDMETTTTARAETEAEVEARIRSQVMKDMADAKSQLESTTIAHVETAAELEDRLVSEAMKDMADAKPRLESTTTVHVETVAEIQARIHAKLMQDMESKLATKAKKLGSKRTPRWAHHVESRIKAKKERNTANQVGAAPEMEATTTARVETEDEMEARIRSEVVKQYIAGDAKPRLESTTTVHVETMAEMEARIRSEVKKDMADAKPQLESTTTSHVETVAEMEARIEDKVIRDMLAAQLQRR